MSLPIQTIVILWFYNLVAQQSAYLALTPVSKLLLLPEWEQAA